MDFSALDRLPAVSETPYVRHVRLEAPLRICIDGKSNRALIAF
jgi:hypothetical protein